MENSELYSKKEIKELLKLIIDKNNNIPDKAQQELKAIIDVGNTPEEILEGCMTYVWLYKVRT